jgi:hypothetical protein
MRYNAFLDRVPSPWIVKPRFGSVGVWHPQMRDEGTRRQVLNDLDRRNNWRDHPSQFVLEKFIVGNVVPRRLDRRRR